MMKYLILNFVFAISMVPTELIAMVLIKGKIFDSESKSPVVGAKIQAFEGTKHLTLPTPINIDGSFNVTLNDFKGSHLTLKVSSNKHYSFRKTIAVEKNECNFSVIFIKPLPNLKLSKLYVASSYDSLSTLVDFFIQNVTPEKIIVKSLTISGNRLSTSNCLDASPELIFEINDTPQKKEVIIREKGVSEIEKIAITGKIELLPCEQIRMNYLINYQFLLEALESFKVRIKIPAKINYKNLPRVINIFEWESVSLIVELEDGTKIQSKL